MIDRYRTTPDDSNSSVIEATYSGDAPDAHASGGQADWSLAAVRLLQGVVYQDENQTTWELLLAHLTELESYFSKIGLRLVVDQNDSMAYLMQSDSGEGENAGDLPRLFRRSQLGYEATLLCVLLRDNLQQFEEHDLQNERCVTTESQLFEMWKEFFPQSADQVKLQKSLLQNLRRLEELKFVRPFEKEPPSWEIRRILKARLPIGELERFKQALLAAQTELEKT